MRPLFFTCLIFLAVFFAACNTSRRVYNTPAPGEGTAIKSTVVLKGNVAPRSIQTKNLKASEVINFSLTLQGVPYQYGSAIKEKGFDCSGFVYYVFNHFKVKVPRVSRDYTNAGTLVTTLESRPGDIILFTGSDAGSGEVGHLGLVTSNNNGVIRFIHSASGKEGGVMVSSMNSYFIPRFVKVIRVFNNFL